MERQFMQDPFQPIPGQTFFPVEPFMEQGMDLGMQFPYMYQPGMYYPTSPYYTQQYMSPMYTQQLYGMVREIWSMVKRFYENEYQTLG